MICLEKTGHLKQFLNYVTWIECLVCYWPFLYAMLYYGCTGAGCTDVLVLLYCLLWLVVVFCLRLLAQQILTHKIRPSFQLVAYLVVPNHLCLVLFCLVGSTLKRLCLGKEHSSSNYPVFIFLVSWHHSPLPIAWRLFHSFLLLVCLLTAGVKLFWLLCLRHLNQEFLR